MVILKRECVDLSNRLGLSRPRSRRLSPLRLRSDRRVARSPSRLGSSVGVASLRWVSAHCRHAVDSNGTSSISASGLRSQLSVTVSRVSLGRGSRSASPRVARRLSVLYTAVYSILYQMAYSQLCTTTVYSVEYAQ